MNILKAYLRCDRGVTAIEYAIIAALIALVIIGSVTILGQKTLTLYQAVVGAFP